MNPTAHPEHRASSSRSKHEGESSFGLCDRLDRARDNSQRQLPTDHDYAVPTREYQTDQSSLKSAQAAARSVLGKSEINNDKNERSAGLTGHSISGQCTRSDFRERLTDGAPMHERHFREGRWVNT